MIVRGASMTFALLFPSMASFASTVRIFMSWTITSLYGCILKLEGEAIVISRMSFSTSSEIGRDENAFAEYL